MFVPGSLCLEDIDIITKIIEVYGWRSATQFHFKNSPDTIQETSETFTIQHSMINEMTEAIAGTVETEKDYF